MAQERRRTGSVHIAALKLFNSHHTKTATLGGTQGAHRRRGGGYRGPSPPHPGLAPVHPNALPLRCSKCSFALGSAPRPLGHHSARPSQSAWGPTRTPRPARFAPLQAGAGGVAHIPERLGALPPNSGFALSQALRVLGDTSKPSRRVCTPRSGFRRATPAPGQSLPLRKL